MNKLAMLAAAAIAVASCVFTGCDPDLPSENTIALAASGIGRAAGFAVEISKTKPEVKDAIVEVIDVAAKVTPDPDQTFAEAWRPIVDEEIGKLVDAGKLSADDASLAKAALYVACDGVDLVFKRYPEAKKYANLVSIAVKNFADGFKSVVSEDCENCRDFGDEEAYKTLKAKFGAGR